MDRYKCCRQFVWHWILPFLNPVPKSAVARRGSMSKPPLRRRSLYPSELQGHPCQRLLAQKLSWHAAFWDWTIAPDVFFWRRNTPHSRSCTAGTCSLRYTRLVFRVADQADTSRHTSYPLITCCQEEYCLEVVQKLLIVLKSVGNGEVTFVPGCPTKAP